MAGWRNAHLWRWLHSDLKLAGAMASGGGEMEPRAQLTTTILDFARHLKKISEAGTKKPPLKRPLELMLGIN